MKAKIHYQITYLGRIYNRKIMYAKWKTNPPLLYKGRYRMKRVVPWLCGRIQKCTWYAVYSYSEGKMW